MAAPDVTGSHGPSTVWAHCGTENAVAAMVEIRDRLNQIGDAPRFYLTTPTSEKFSTNAAVPIDTRDAMVLQTMLSDENPALMLSVEDPLKLGPLNACLKAAVRCCLVHPPAGPTQDRPWLWRKTALSGVLKQVDKLFVSSERAEAEWRGLGAPATSLERTPPLQAGILAPACNEAERVAISNILAARPVWFLNNLPLEEFTWAVQAIQTAQRSWPRLVTIIDAANPADVAAFKDTLIREGIIVHDRMVEGEPDEVTQVFMADGPDEVGLWYRLAALSYLGGTLTGKPCRNPLEAASLGSSIVHGPRVLNHRSAFDRLDTANATTRISHGRQLGDTVSAQLAPDACAEKANAAWGVTSEGAEMIDILTAYIADKLDLDLTV